MQNEAGTCQEKWHKTDTRRSQYVHATTGPEKKTAAPAGPRNGGNTTKKHSSSFEANSYHNPTDAAICAGQWYAQNRAACTHSIVSTLRRMFGVSALEAVQAIRYANGVQP